jgi:hypothetical protein
MRRAKDRPDLVWARNLAGMMQVSLIGYASAGTFLNLGFFDLYYIILACIVGLDATVKAEIAKSEEAEAHATRPKPRMRATAGPPLQAPSAS